MDIEKSADLLTIGTKVEVTTNEEGHFGSWYPATIINTPEPNSNPLVLIEYVSLVTEEDLTKRLQEYIHVSDLRPLPPTSLTDHKGELELYDVVEANYRDGWWTGVIVDIIEDSNRNSRTFLVAFEHPYQEIVFKGCDLRLHLDWVNGNWIRPCKKTDLMNEEQSIHKNSTNLLSIGTKVEVTTNQEGLYGSWYPAIITNTPELNSEPHYWIEYEGIFTENDVLKPLREYIHISNIRPLPPKALTDHKGVLHLHDEVEACYRNGFWTGVIVKVIHDNTFLVALEHPYEEIVFSKQDLRLHFDWIDGKWVRPCKKEIKKRRKNFRIRSVLKKCSSRKRKRKDYRMKSLKKLKLDNPTPAHTSQASTNEPCDRAGYISISSDEGDKSVKSLKFPKGPQCSIESLTPLKNIQKPKIKKERKELLKRFLASLQKDDDEQTEEGDKAIVQVASNNVEENENLTIIAVNTGTLEKIHNWPFIKSSRVWETVESMDVFTKMPQTPHFSPLNNYEEKLREELAINLMMKFAYKADIISRLSIDDMKDTSIINGVLDSLNELISHGFDVTDLINKLRKIEVEGEMEEIKSEIRVREGEKMAAEYEIKELGKQKKVLEEKCEEIEMMKCLKDEEIEKMECVRSVLSGEIEGLKVDFERIVASLGKGCGNT